MVQYVNFHKQDMCNMLATCLAIQMMRESERLKI